MLEAAQLKVKTTKKRSALSLSCLLSWHTEHPGRWSKERRNERVQSV